MDAIETPEVENIETTEVETDPAREEAAETPETPAYEPNYKFRVGENEFEFDDRVKAVVTSKENEDYLRDIFTKAHGLELSKKRSEEREQKFQQTQSEYGQLRSEHERMQNTFRKLDGLKTEDFGTFQHAMKIPDQVIVDRALELLALSKDPNPQQAFARANQVYADRFEMLRREDQATVQSQQTQAIQRQMHEMQMSQALSRPEITSFASEYDRRMGQAGAFQEEVKRLGTIEFYQGRYLDPQVAVAQAHERLSKLLGPVAAPTTQPAATQQTPAKPALPNMGSGRTGTATSRKPKSIADLRKLAESFME